MSEDAPKASGTSEEVLTVAESGRRGGCRTRERHGVDHYRESGAKGGRTTSARHGRAHYDKIGKLGGQRTQELIRLGLAAEAAARAAEAAETPDE